MHAASIGTSLLSAALAITCVSRASADIVISVDKNTQTMTVTVDGETRYVWAVSTGRPGNDTPSGNFRPNRMDKDHLSQEWDNAPMPYSVFFDLHGHAFHGFLNTDHIGNPASHGCVRLVPANAAVLFELIKERGMKDTSVIITGQTPSLQSLMTMRHRLLLEAATALPAQSVEHSSGQSPPYQKEASLHLQETAAYQPQQVAVYDNLVRRPPVIAQAAPKIAAHVTEQSPPYSEETAPRPQEMAAYRPQQTAAYDNLIGLAQVTAQWQKPPTRPIWALSQPAAPVERDAVATKPTPPSYTEPAAVELNPAVEQPAEARPQALPVYRQPVAPAAQAASTAQALGQRNLVSAPTQRPYYGPRLYFMVQPHYAQQAFYGRQIYYYYLQPEYAMPQYYRIEPRY